jgi:bifunctional N-acetylglucosamine-1-phosphate-uridyltransferase/glucosamine-1-phosphate-acetyltransferase GlmU-like protein
VNILILAAGQVEFETHDGGYPLCLTEIDGDPLIQRIVERCSEIAGARFVFALKDKDIEQHHLKDVVTQLAPGSRVMSIPGQTRGSACTALLAASALPRNEELLVLSANELIDVDLRALVENFRERGLDAGTVTFKSVHPRYSYVRLGEGGFVTEVAQQKPISKHATAGLFWFASVGSFVDAAKNILRKDDHTNGSYYLSKTLNEIILKQGVVGVHEIDNKRYFPLKSERQLLQHYDGAPA